jgi:hypothetical protein
MFELRRHGAGGNTDGGSVFLTIVKHASDDGTALEVDLALGSLDDPRTNPLTGASAEFLANVTSELA